MPIEIYRIIHVMGLAMVIMPLGALTLHTMNGGTRATNQHVKLMAITHGLGLMVILISGFGMLARLGHLADFPIWAIAKLVIWLLLGAANVAASRFRKSAMMLWFNLIVLVGIAATLGILKPGG